MSMSIKDPLFDFDSSKEISVLRSKEDTVKSQKAATGLSHRRKLHADSEPTKLTPKPLVSFPSSDRVNREQFESQVILLEVKLTEQLKKAHKASNAPLSFESQFPVYTQVFQDVIDRDKHFGSLLAKIKAFYDSWLISFSKHSHDDAAGHLYEQCAEQLRAAKHKLKLCSEDKKLMLRRIGALSKETVELGQTLQEVEAENEQLKGKMEDIRKVEVGGMPKDDRAWKCLVVENRSYQAEIHRLRDKLKYSTCETDALQTLILRMKDRGFPIDELDDSQSPRLTNSNSDLDDAEPIVTGPEKRMEKPRHVPSLQLKGLGGVDEEGGTTQSKATVDRGVDVQATIDRGVIDDFQAFLSKEIPPGFLCDRRLDDSM